MPSALCRCSIAIARAGAPPRQTAADGGYASRANLAAAKARGIAGVAFHKKCGITITEMVKSPSVYRRLRNFRQNPLENRNNRGSSSLELVAGKV